VRKENIPFLKNDESPTPTYKRERIDLQKIKDKHKFKEKHWAIQFNQKMLQYKRICYS